MGAPFRSELDADARAAYFRGMVPIWGGGLDEQRFLAWQRRLADAPESAGRYRLHGLFDEAGVLLAALKGYALEGELEGRRARVLGIGAVFTPEAQRRRGHASRLLHLVLEEAQGLGMDAALLFSDIGERYYAELGFHLVESAEVLVDPQLLPRRAGARPAAPGDEEQLSRVLAQGRLPGARFSLARDGWTVRFQLRRLRELARVREVGEPEWGLIVDGGDGEAAAMVRHTKEALDVLDASWSSPAAREALLGGLRECALRAGRPRVRFWPAHQLRDLFPSVPRGAGLAMIAPLHAKVKLPPEGARAELALLDHI